MWFKNCLFLISTFLMLNQIVAGLDYDKVYEPNPPVTHRAFMTIRYFDRSAGKTKEQEITIDLYGTVVPKTVFNFASLGNGVKARIQGQDPDDIKVLGYKGTKFTEVVPNGMILGGDVIPEIGPFSVHGPGFPDENFFLKHDRPGRLSMANTGPDSNNCKFFISTKVEPATELDNRNVVFGQVVSGLEGLLDNVQNVETGAYHRPVKDVEITSSLVNELKLAEPEALHTGYVQRLEKFKGGDKSQGITMKEMLNEGSKKKKVVKKSKKAGGKKAKTVFGIQPTQALYAIIGLAAVLVLIKLVRKQLKNRSKNVSIRAD
ncbi:hypothetical protein Kpol_1028p43 [Vanderwaltozyma polyspora DSM 70294]|uniref:PPIase cyclophilin-type domain-containing protein n=1 Tax=Vanderwaltozyma polyspora (strain ATCC 22028 / DSM 70294 / BCRC 21397 / CBS 2163 / NBRC 10782 / NRRL Y-8283 / UCD 57-17) TaxID=436907 RepID=A7TG12_VANPO|nr:uncharacterized protein Kpol_1028p43 [Vanderwaltozyma polyspora DSM 70294]EDO18769.1 hypothetical protein Kpol_1028p43 [Vanderwaltozyma polyspora DSM 70294]